MDLGTKWELRQTVLELISYLASPTTIFILLPIVADAAKFMEVGIAMYPGFAMPKGMDAQWVLKTFADQSVWPLLRYLPITLTLDLAYRRFGLGLRG